MAKIPEYLISIFEEAIKENNYNIKDINKKALTKRKELRLTGSTGGEENILRNFKSYLADKNAMSVNEYTSYIKERIANPNKPQTPNWNKPLANTPLAAKGFGATKNVPIGNLNAAEKLLSPNELSQWRAYTQKQQTKVKRERKLKGERIDTTTGQVIKDPNIRSDYLSKIYLRKNLRRALKSKAYAKLTPLEKLKYINFNKRIDVMGDLIKKNPNYLLSSPKVVDALSTTVNPITGKISKKNPTFTDLKKRRVFEIEHIDPVVKGQTQGRGAFLSNLQVLPETVHKNFKTNAETFLNKNYNNPKYANEVKEILNKAKELKVEIRVNDVGKVGYKPKFENFLDKADDAINFYVRDPEAKKLYSQGVDNLKPVDTTFNYKSLGFKEPPSAEILKKITEETTRPAFIGISDQNVLVDLARSVVRSGGSLAKALPTIALGAIGVGTLSVLGGSAEAAEIPQPKVKQLPVGEPLKYDATVGSIVNATDDKKADQNQILEYVKDNPLKVAAGTSLGFAAEEIPGAYKTARGVGERGPLPKGKGRIRSALGISGALRPVLTTFGTPLVTALFEGAIGAKRLDDGETMTDVLKDPLGPALGVSLMEPITKLSGVVRDAKPTGIMGGITQALNPFNFKNVGTARPGLTSKILRMGLSPMGIRVLSKGGLYGVLAGLGLAGLDQYNKYQNEEGMVYNLFND